MRAFGNLVGGKIETALRGSQVSKSITLALLLLSVPPAAQAQFTFTTNNGALTITGYTGPGGPVVIPSSVGGLPVTSVGDWAFNISGATSVTIPSSITNIGYRAFNSCYYLTTIALPTGLTSIGSMAFYYCTSLSNIFIPATVTAIGSLPFNGCSSLSGITVDGQNASYSSLDGVLFGKGQNTLLQYPGGKFGNYIVPSTVSTVASSAFQACIRLTAVTIPHSVSPPFSSGSVTTCKAL